LPFAICKFQGQSRVDKSYGSWSAEGRAKNSIWTSGVNDFYPQCFVESSGYALGLQTAPRVKIIHFTPSVHNILSIYIKQSRVSYAIYNSRTAGQIFMIFILLDLSPPRLAE
jgi:hypothetical protein